MTPTTEPAKRIATLFKRRLSTSWSGKEIRKFKELVKQGCFVDLDDLRLVEAYYVFSSRKPDNYLRKDLYTFLNNYMGEVDRAREWSRHNEAKVRKANPQRPLLKLSTDADYQRAGEIAKAEIEKLRMLLTPQSK